MDGELLRELERTRDLLERQEGWRKRLSTKAREIVNALSTENARLRAALVAYEKDDE